MTRNLGWQMALALACLLFAGVYLLATAPATPPELTAVVTGEPMVATATATSCLVDPTIGPPELAVGIVGAPATLNPLLSDGNVVDEALVNLLFQGLTQVDRDGNLQPSLATSWTVSDDGRSLHFDLNPTARWHDGLPVTSADVVFTYQLLQAPEFPGSAGLKTLWAAIEITAVDDYAVEFILPEPYAPFLYATSLGILPAHRFLGLNVAALRDHEFSYAPVGSGPFRLIDNHDWRTTGLLRLARFARAGEAPPPTATLAFRFFPDSATLMAALAAGEVAVAHELALVDSALPTSPTLRFFTVPDNHFSQLLFNVDSRDAEKVALTNEIAVRRALAYGTDRPRLVDDILLGQGSVFEGPFAPQSPVENQSLLTPYSYNPISATAQLEDAGWQVPVTGTIRARAGEPLALRLLYPTTSAALADSLIAQWEMLAIAVTPRAVAPEALREALFERDFDVALVTVLASSEPDLYDFWSQEAIVRGQNYAGWNNRRASELLENGRQSYDPFARRQYYEDFLRLFDRDLPALTLFQRVSSYGVDTAVVGDDISVRQNIVSRYRNLLTSFADRTATVNCVGDN